MTGSAPHLGDLEQLVMLALVQLGSEAYGVNVHGIITERTQRTTAFATIYTTLARLESKGYVESFVGAPTAARGGRRKKHFVLTAAGSAALKRSLGDVRTMAQGLGSSWSSP